MTIACCHGIIFEVHKIIVDCLYKININKKNFEKIYTEYHNAQFLFHLIYIVSAINCSHFQVINNYLLGHGSSFFQAIS